MDGRFLSTHGFPLPSFSFTFFSFSFSVLFARAWSSSRLIGRRTDGRCGCMIPNPEWRGATHRGMAIVVGGAGLTLQAGWLVDGERSHSAQSCEALQRW